MSIPRNAAACTILIALWSTAHADCPGQEKGSIPVAIEHFATDAPAVPSSIGFHLADLQGSGQDELIEGGGRYASGDYPNRPTIAIVQARERNGDLGFTTRASLAFSGEVLLAMQPLPANASGTRVAIVTRSTTSPETRLRMIDGASWTADCAASIPLGYVAAELDIASNQLYLQAADRIDVFSMPDLVQIRSIASGGGDHFAIAQLDDDPALEIIVGGVPGLVIDSSTGDIEWTYSPGFLGSIEVGNFGIDAHQGFVTSGPTSVDVFTGAPYGVHGSLIQLSFQNSDLAYTVHDIDGGGRDAVLLSVKYAIGSQSVYSLRTFDADTLQVSGEDIYPDHPRAVGIGAIKGRVPGTTEITDDIGDTIQSLRIHALGAMSETWSETPGNGAFAIGMGTFDGVPSIAYADGEVHVVHADDWSEVARTPLVFNDPTIPFNVRDLAAIHSQTAGGASLALGGSRFFGSMERLSAVPWSIDWIFGVANDPAGTPFDGAVHRILAYDAASDGEEDAIVAARGSPFDNPGAIVSLVDGADGHVLWLTDRLGGEYAQINDLQLSARTGVPRVLAAGTEARYVFDAATGAQVWSDANPAIAASSIGASGNFAFGNADGSIEAFDANGAPAWSSRVRSPLDAMTQPAVDVPILVSSGSRLRWLDASNGAQIGVSRPMTAGLAKGNRWVVERGEADQTVHVVATSLAGIYELSIGLPPPDAIFYDGLE